VGRILILENYPPTRHALAMTLQRAGWEVVLAQTDHEALLALEQIAYDVLLLEADSPTGDGWRVLSTLQSGHNAIPVVVLVGQEELYQQRAWALGASVVLTKPIGRDALLAGVTAALKHSPSNGEHPPVDSA
jgi:DNA-binding response OmpR family regulator